jgi:ribosomal protein L4
MNNFKDIVTGEEFKVSKVYTKYVDGKVKYFNRNWEHIISPAGNEAIPIVRNTNVPKVGVKTKTANRY